MKTIRILGTGCDRCVQLAANARTAADELGIEYELEKVTDINEIVKSGVIMTPAMTIDGEVKVSGMVAEVEQIKEMISETTNP